MDANLIERVTGYADTRPLPGEPPDSEANQRITISLTLVAKNGPDEAAKPALKPAVKSTPLAALPPVDFQPP